ncbi:hypothetical protein HU200_065127 [Digitaria exilis]|uniref:Transcription repressor n=1 Tax=Digitaria exilis TaxID=1010633 RepID=A0A835A0M7_9POAL|nr:hypothetical protein HU200_065127 [Digitaria exilis]
MEKEEDVGAAMAESITNDAARKCKKGATLHRSFLHLSKALKKLHPRRGHHQQAAKNASGELPTPSSSSAAASFLSGCMHPRTHSFASARRRHCHEDDALAVNFRSLRISPAATAVADVGDEGSPPPQDFYSSDGGVEAEERGGVAPPPPSPPALMTTTNKAVVGGVAVVTFSAEPYEDFRRSMREMVDAAAAAPAVDWEFMEELLFCYLRLNDSAVHREILRAFTDTVAALRRRRRRAAAKSIRRRRTTRRREDGADGSDDDGE